MLLILRIKNIVTYIMLINKILCLLKRISAPTFTILFFFLIQNTNCHAQYLSISYGRGLYTYGFRNVHNDMEIYNYLHPYLEKPFDYNRLFYNFSLNYSDFYDRDEDYSPMLTLFAKHQQSDFKAFGIYKDPITNTDTTFNAKYSIYYTSLGSSFYFTLVPQRLFLGAGGMEFGFLTQKYHKESVFNQIIANQHTKKSTVFIWGWEFSLAINVLKNPLLQIKPYYTLHLFPIMSTQWGEGGNYYFHYNHAGVSLTLGIKLTD